jgi:putative endonuclease
MTRQGGYTGTSSTWISENTLCAPVIPAKAGIQYPSAVKQPCVYILASGRNGTLYVGVTSILVQRVWQHQNDLADGFTKRYGVHTLVWFEPHETMESAIAREKTIKGWHRAWKLSLIETANPTWHDLYGDVV